MWSLAIEEHFYSIWVFVVVLLPAAVLFCISRWMVILPAVAAAAYWLWAWVPPSSEVLYSLDLFRFPSLVGGSMVAMREDWFEARPARAMSIAIALLGLSALLGSRDPLANDVLRTMPAGVACLLCALWAHWTLAPIATSIQPQCFWGLISIQRKRRD